MASLAKKIIKVDLEVTLVALHDKKSMFRPQSPTVYVVRALAGSGILFEKAYDTQEEAKKIYHRIITDCGKI
jgi:hypothetical protein